MTTRVVRVASKSRPRKKGGSSREASAESNDEPDTGATTVDDDDASITLPSARPEGPLRPRDSFEATAIPPGQSGSGVVKRRSAPAPPTELRALEEQGYEGENSGASTYDGDVSSTNVTSKRATSLSQGHTAAHYNARAAGAARPTVTNTYSSTSTLSADAEVPLDSPQSPVVLASSASGSSAEPRTQTQAKSPFHPPAPHGMLSKITAAELQRRMLESIAGQGPDGQVRPYKINPPPVGRPIRIYADGVYDLFHYAHALQLRQAKLFFPDVYLLVGVVADELVRQYKATPVLTSEERYESVRNCKWVDEVVEDAPWIIDADFLDRHQVDYVAHDEEPYVSAGSEDVYRFVKERGQFIPTRRTSGISTTELLERIVAGYREGGYDNKLLKIGREDLCSSRASASSRAASRPPSPRT